MNITCIVVGKTKDKAYEEFQLHYIGKLKHYCNFQYIEIPALKNASKLSVKQLQEEEGKIILSKIDPKQQLILLDEKGKSFTSEEFARDIEKKGISGTGHITFVIGGAYGFSPNMYEAAHSKLALSKMTFTHQMVRVIFLEQLYRTFSIIKGEKYHH